VVPPVDFGQPHGQIGPLRIQPARLFKGSRGVGPLPRRETGSPCAKASKARVCGDLSADGYGLISVRQSAQWFHTNQPAPAMTTTIQIMLIMGLLSSAGV
jgi:hypothetical protein